MTLNREDLALLLDLASAAVIAKEYAGEPAKETRLVELRFRLLDALENWTWDQDQGRWEIRQQ